MNIGKGTGLLAAGLLAVAAHSAGAQSASPQATLPQTRASQPAEGQASAASSAEGQAGAESLESRQGGRGERNVIFFSSGSAVMPYTGSVDILSGEGSVIGEVVVDKPYSAESITESVQLLTDGNRITHTNRARLYRDSEGRTRREHTLDAIGPWAAGGDAAAMVVINDPVAEVSYVLDPNTETARRMTPLRLQTTMHTVEGAPGDGGAIIRNRVLIEHGAVSRGTAVVNGESVEAGPAPAPHVRVRAGVARGPVVAGPGVVAGGPGVVGGGPGVDAGTAETVPAPFAIAMPPPVHGAFAAVRVGSPFGGAATVTTEDLGEQVLEGVLAHGTRETQTIPAGAIGNERPIEVVSETWYSAELEALVLRRTTDPRFGETTYRLVNVVVGEPSPDLFTVPSGYQVDP